MFRLSYVSQKIIDVLYEDIKSLFINPARKFVVIKNIRIILRVLQNNLETWQTLWFNNECEMIRKQYMSLKNSLKPVNTSDQQYQIFHEHGKMYKK